MKEYFFARFGKTYGPFTEGEVTQMQAKGELKQFTWSWDAPANAWTPLDPAPAPPRAPTVTFVAPAAGRSGMAPPTRSPAVAAGGSGFFEVICHNQHDYLSGQVQFMTETGCELVSPDDTGSPLFGERAGVILNVFDAASGQLQNVRAQVCAVSRDKVGGQGAWKYQLRWEHRPDFS